MKKEELIKVFVALFICFGLIIFLWRAGKKLEENYRKCGVMFSVAKVTNRPGRKSSYTVKILNKGKEAIISTSTLWNSGSERKTSVGRKVYIVYPNRNIESFSILGTLEVPPDLPTPPYAGWTLEQIKALDPNFNAEEFLPKEWFMKEE